MNSTSEHEHDIKVLNTLIETTLDSVDGYAEAAKDADNPRYRNLFEQRASERRRVASELQSQVRTLGGKPEDEGSILAAGHRVFVSIRDSLSKGDKSVVEEVERGEDHIKAKFEKAIEDDDLSTPVRSAIKQAYGSVRTGHDQMRDLKHSLENRA
jgi:uncharacterized protein (TIGR02284 family)